MVNLIGNISGSSYVSITRHHSMAEVRGMLISASSRTYRDIPNISTSGPIPLAIPAEVPRLANIVIVEVAELCFHAIAARAWHDYIRLLEYLVLARSIFGTPCRNGRTGPQHALREFGIHFSSLFILSCLQLSEEKNQLSNDSEFVGMGCICRKRGAI